MIVSVYFAKNLSGAGRQARWLAACLAIWALAPALALGDKIDKELFKQAPELIQQLQSKGYKNVGVLKFMVKKANQAPTFTAGAINDVMATRLENWLVLANDVEKPIGIIRDATMVAAGQAPKASYRTQEGREALFKLSYPLAWGNQKVAADAFLTGMVELSANMRETTVSIGVFDKKSTKLQDLKSFKVQTDRSILSDSGQSFALAKRTLLKARGGLEELEDEAADSAQQLDQQAGPNKSDPNKPGPFEGLKLGILYDGQFQAPTPDPTNPGEYKITDPREGQRIEFSLENVSNQRLGVVIKVNGVSLLGLSEDEDARCQKWILEPGGKYALRGFYDPSAGTVDLFKALSDEESRSVWSNYKRAGFIDVALFAESDVPPGGDPLQYGRGLSHRALKKSPPTSLADLKKKLRDAMNSRTTAKGLIAASGTKEEAKLAEAELKNPQQIANGHIQYYVLPSAP